MNLKKITEEIRKAWVDSLNPGDLLVSLVRINTCREVGDIIKVLENRDNDILYENVDSGRVASFRKSVNAINKVTVKAV